MARNLVRSFCKGGGKRFGGTDCESYNYTTGECFLLRECELAEVFEKGRCEPFEMLKRAVERFLRKYRDLIEPEEHIEAMAFELAERIKRQRLTQGFKIYVLQGYINKTVYAEVIGMLHHETTIVRRQCGYCKYLSQSKPYTCLRETITTSEYGEIANPYYGNTRKLTKKACKEGFEPLEDTSIQTFPDTSQPAVVFEQDYSAGILLFDMTRMLGERAKRAKDQKTGRQYERQYIVFCRLIDLLKNGISQKDAVEMIAATLGVSAKTVNREILEIREFFEQEGVF